MTESVVSVSELRDPGTRGSLCMAIAAALPDWFGTPDANHRYAEDAIRFKGLVAQIDGLNIGLLIHTTDVADPYLAKSLCIHWLGVLPTHHRRGAGTSLIGAAIQRARSSGFDSVMVETLDPAVGNPHYLATFGFYEKLGFKIARHFRSEFENDMVELHFNL